MGQVKPGHERLRELLPAFEQPEVWIRFPRQLGDVIFGQGGDDTLHGDAPSAGAGADDDGIDVIFGGPGDDKIYGGSGGTIEVLGRENSPAILS